MDFYSGYLGLVGFLDGFLARRPGLPRQRRYLPWTLVRTIGCPAAPMVAMAIHVSHVLVRLSTGTIGNSMATDMYRLSSPKLSWHRT